MSTDITLIGNVRIDGWHPYQETFTGTGDGTLQTFPLDLTGLSPQRFLSISAICLSADGTTLYPAGTTLNVNPLNPTMIAPGASVQVPTDVDFVLTVGFTVCN